MTSSPEINQKIDPLALIEKAKEQYKVYQEYQESLPVIPEKPATEDYSKRNMSYPLQLVFHG